MSRGLPYALVAVKVVLLLWGALGLWEYLVPSADFGLQNAGFPSGTQLLHWLLLLGTGALFVIGFARRWRHTVVATITMYATLATLCFVETVDFGAFGAGAQRFVFMSAEYLVYLTLSLYLLRSRRVAEHFDRPPSAQTA